MMLTVLGFRDGSYLIGWTVRMSQNTIWMNDMNNSSSEELLARLFETCTGMPMDLAKTLPPDKLGRICLRRQQRQLFKNAVEDFITITLISPLFLPNEDSLRMELLRTVQMAWGYELEQAMHAGDEEFAKGTTLARPGQPLFEVLAFLRATCRNDSQTDDARSSFLSHPTQYEKEEHQRLFQSLVKLIRKTALEAVKDRG
jgi:hypothetical protein